MDAKKPIEIAGFLGDAKGVLHVGAHEGQESEIYERSGLKVIWVEPLEHIFNKLRENIRHLPLQKAYQYLITDKEDAAYDFHVSSNEGKSSSIFDLHLHKQMWPNVRITDTTRMQSITLDSFMKKELIDPSGLDVLVIDTQGSELLVLKGAAVLLQHIRYVFVEAADFEAYAGCCMESDILDFMKENGFREIFRQTQREREGLGSYYDILFERPGMKT